MGGREDTFQQDLEQRHPPWKGLRAESLVLKTEGGCLLPRGNRGREPTGVAQWLALASAPGAHRSTPSAGWAGAGPAAKKLSLRSRPVRDRGHAWRGATQERGTHRAAGEALGRGAALRGQPAGRARGWWEHRASVNGASQ